MPFFRPMGLGLGIMMAANMVMQFLYVCGNCNHEIKSTKAGKIVCPRCKHRTLKVKSKRKVPKRGKSK